MNNVTFFEELSMNTHPALNTQYYDGWFLRFANSYTNRANSVNMLFPSTLNIEDKIKYCEENYSAQGLPTVFKITPVSTEIDKLLEQKGYEIVTKTNLMTKPLSATETVQLESIITAQITEIWQDSYFRLNNVDMPKIQTAKAIQANILNEKLCALIEVSGIVAACGLCVIEREYAGLLDIVVDEKKRGKGLGYDICVSLLNEAVKRGAKTAYLQVVADNTVAINLYKKLGFTDCYQYWYRVKR